MADLATIETALTQISKNMATKKEVLDLITDERRKDEEKSQALAAGHEKALKEAQAELDKQKLTLADIHAQLKLLKATRYDGLKDADGNYKGVWGNVQTAKAFGLWIMSDILGNQHAKKLFDATGIERRDITGKALESSEVTTGAALAPSAFIPRLITLIESFSTYRQLAQEYPLSAGDNSFPVQTGDPTVYCPGAGVAPSASDLAFKPMALNPLEWVAYCAINRDMEEDSAIALGELVGRALARGFGNKEDACGFVGDGTKDYFNIFGARAALRAVDATITNVKGLKVQATAGAWSAIVLNDIIGTAALMPGYADINGEVAWVTNKAFYLTVMVALALAVGGVYASEVTRPGFMKSPSFLDYPVRYGGGMPAVKPAADHCPLLFGNWKMGAALGDRRKLTIETSGHVKFLERQLAIMGTERISINNFGVGDTTSAGPIVGFWGDIS